MEWEFVMADEQPVSEWSGGQTRELYIAPAGSSYAARDFTLRLSTAGVAASHSVFTALPDYERWLLLLSGELRLQHDGGEVVCMKPFQVNAFSGQSRTLSWGECQDFNVMLRRTAEKTVTLEGWQGRGVKLTLPAAADEQHFFYAAAGGAEIEAAGIHLQLPAGALLHLCGASPELHLLLQGALVHVGLVHRTRNN